MSCSWRARSVDATLTAGPIFLPERSLQNLAGAALGKALDELDGLGNLETREVLAAVIENFTLGGRVAVVQGDERLGDLAPGIVRHRYDGAFEHGGMLVEDPLDLRGGNVLSAAQHHVLDAVDDEDVALLVDGGEIAGRE